MWVRRKTKDARVIKMTREVHAVISMCIEGKAPDDRMTVCLHVKTERHWRFPENLVQNVLQCWAWQDDVPRL
jgi:hypothetical protein